MSWKIWCLTTTREDLAAWAHPAAPVCLRVRATQLETHGRPSVRRGRCTGWLCHQILYVHSFVHKRVITLLIPSTCENGKWHCSENFCPARCVVEGQFVTTIDGKHYAVPGKCTYIASQVILLVFSNILWLTLMSRVRFLDSWWLSWNTYFWCIFDYIQKLQVSEKIFTVTHKKKQSQHVNKKKAFTKTQLYQNRHNAHHAQPTPMPEILPFYIPKPLPSANQY